MKKLCTIIALLAMFSFSTQAQSTVSVDGGSGGLAYEEGDKIFQAGIGFGYYGYGYFGSRTLSVPPLTASLELGIHEYISVGAYAGYASFGYRYLTNNRFSYNFLSVGARGSFHYLPLLNDVLDGSLNEEKLDFYITLLAGLEFQSYSGDDFGLNYGNNTRFILGPVVGFRYKFNDGFGAYFEGGRGALAYATIGVSLHF